MTFKAALIVFGKWDCPLYAVIYYIDVTFKAALNVFGKWDCPLYTVIYYIEVTFKAGLIVFGKETVLYIQLFRAVTRSLKKGRQGYVDRRLCKSPCRK